LKILKLKKYDFENHLILHFKLIHGVSQDFLKMRSNFKISIVNMFDTMELCKVMEMPKQNFKYVVERYLGYFIFKFGRKADWNQRPLPDLHKKYARTDTRILFLLYTKLCILANLDEIDEMKSNLKRYCRGWEIQTPI